MTITTASVPIPESEFDVIKKRLTGTWLQELSDDGDVIGAWELLANGEFRLAWHRAPIRVKAMMNRLEGRWELSDAAQPRLSVNVTWVTSPVKRIIDVAYMGTALANPVIFVIRSLWIGATELGAAKLANAGFGFNASVQFEDNNLVHLQRSDDRGGASRQLITWRRL